MAFEWLRRHLLAPARIRPVAAWLRGLGARPLVQRLLGEDRERLVSRLVGKRSGEGLRLSSPPALQGRLTGFLRAAAGNRVQLPVKANAGSSGWFVVVEVCGGGMPVRHFANGLVANLLVHHRLAGGPRVSPEGWALFELALVSIKLTCRGRVGFLVRLILLVRHGMQQQTLPGAALCRQRNDACRAPFPPLSHARRGVGRCSPPIGEWPAPCESAPPLLRSKLHRWGRLVQA